ncbi:MAG: glutathione S-transferase N-terminal domain-containing protein, partial [Patescibacteria group bacterium]
YCAAVLHSLDELKLERVEKNISDPAVVEELVSLGGKRQVPYLVDSDKGVQMYESADIAAYLHKTYGNSEDPKENVADSQGHTEF